LLPDAVLKMLSAFESEAVDPDAMRGLRGRLGLRSCLFRLALAKACPLPRALGLALPCDFIAARLLLLLHELLLLLYDLIDIWRRHLLGARLASQPER